MSEFRIVTPPEAQEGLDDWFEELRGTFKGRLLHTVATEPKRIRLAEADAWALGHAAGVESANQWSAGNIQHDGMNPYREGNEAVDPLRAAVVKALRDMAETLYPVPAYARVEQHAAAIENGAPL